MQVVGDKCAGVIGILKYFKLPVASKGKDHFVAFCLVDESQHSSGLSCVIFNPLKDLLPVATCPGQVVMVKGLTINSFQGNLQGRGHESTLVGIFSEDPAAPVPKQIGDFYDLKDREKARIKQLRDWAAQDRPFLLNSKLEDLSVFNYCSTVCLVVRVAVDKHCATVLNVYDGTAPKCQLSTISGPITILSHNPTLQDTYQDSASVVTLAPALQSKVVTGDVVQLLNLCLVGHAPSHTASTSEVMELVLQNDPWCQGSINVLPNNSLPVQQFRSQLPKPEIPPPPTSSAAGFTLPPHLGLSTVLSSAVGGGALPTVVTLAELREAAIGSVHIVEVKVMGINKEMCTTFESITQLRCSWCKTCYQTPLPDDPEASQLMTAGDVCVVCSAEDLHEPNLLQFMYGFTLLVSDHSSQVEVSVSGDEGRRFFSNVNLVPVNLYEDEGSRVSHWKLLCKLSGSTTTPFHEIISNTGSDGPSLRLCIAVYVSVSGNRRYRIINTNLSLM